MTVSPSLCVRLRRMDYRPASPDLCNATTLPVLHDSIRMCSASAGRYAHQDASAASIPKS